VLRVVGPVVPVSQKGLSAPLRRIESGGQVAGEFAGRDQDRIEADRPLHRIGVRSEPVLRCVDDARLLARGQRFGSIVETLACLDLDENQRAARRATMSISPSGVLKRRARMR
jgi:hypothetical protein